MELCRYQPSEPPKYVKEIMTELVLYQRYKHLKIQKPPILNNIPLTKPQSTIEQFEKEVQHQIGHSLKHKLIRGIKKNRMDIQKQKKVQKLYNLQLLYRLNNSVLLSVKNHKQPPFSILDTKEEGDYLTDGDKKQHPHFSNVLKLTQIPNQNSQYFRPKINKITKLPPFGIQQNCVFKIKQIYRFPKLLFRLGNMQFEKLSQQLSLSTTNAKLLYDLFNDYFDVEDKINLKTNEQRVKYLKKVKKYLLKAFNKYKTKNQGSSQYIPMEEQFVNLKEIRECLNAKKQDSESDNEGG